MPLFDCFALSEQGRGQEVNDDFFGMDAVRGIFVVADGMGGRPGGARASRAAVEAFVEALQRLDPPDRCRDDRLTDAVLSANLAVRAIGTADPTVKGLGTTLTAAVFHGTRGKIVHVGDSRALLLREGRMSQLTVDHTLATELLARSHLTEASARRFPLRNVLSRAVGTQETVAADIDEVALARDDWLVLATDGLPKAMTLERLGVVMEAAGAAGAEAMCRAIMRAVLENPPADSCTVLAVRLEQVLSHG